jgi:hypothetical protein
MSWFAGRASSRGRAHRRLAPVVAVLFAVLGSAMTVPAVLAARQAGGYCATSGARYRDPTAFLGVDAPDLGSRGTTDLRCTTGRIASDALGYVRTELNWAAVEWPAGSYHFAFYDELMTALAEHHLQWLPVVLNAPTFRTRSGTALKGGIAPPADPYQFADFVRLMVARYGPGGSFWRSHRRLHYDPVRAWQVWNEPSLAGYWEPDPSPAAYTRLLRATWRVVKRRYPRTILVAAGMPFYQGIQFYRQMLRDGAGRYFDAAAWHDYSAKLRYAREYLTLLRQALDAAGKRKTPIWVTEWGWGTGARRRESTAMRLDSGLLRFMVQRRFALRLTRLFYFEWRDTGGGPINGVYLGLYRANDTPRPVAPLIRLAAARLNR